MQGICAAKQDKAGIAKGQKVARDGDHVANYLPLADASALQELGVSRHANACQQPLRHAMYDWPITATTMRPTGRGTAAFLN